MTKNIKLPDMYIVYVVSTGALDHHWERGGMPYTKAGATRRANKHNKKIDIYSKPFVAKHKVGDSYKRYYFSETMTYTQAEFDRDKTQWESYAKQYGENTRRAVAKLDVSIAEDPMEKALTEYLAKINYNVSAGTAGMVPTVEQMVRDILVIAGK